MTYPFPPDIEQLVKEHMAAGDYASEDELLLDALRVLQERKEDLAAVEAGLDDVEAGRVRSFEEVAHEIRRKHGFLPEA